MKDAYYFRHDSNARHDPKMLILAKEYGMAGIGRFWCLIEILREQEDYVFSIEEKHNRRALRHELDFKTDEELEEFLEFLVETLLIVREGNRIASLSLIKRMEHLENVRGKRSEAGKKGRALQLGTTPEKTLQAKNGQMPANTSANFGQMPATISAKNGQMPKKNGHLSTYLSTHLPTHLSTNLSTDLSTDLGHSQANVSQVPSHHAKQADSAPEPPEPKLDYRVLYEPDTEHIYIYAAAFAEIPEGAFFVPSGAPPEDRKVFIKLSDEQVITARDKVLYPVKEPSHIVFTNKEYAYAQ